MRIAGGTAYRYDENGNLIEKGSEYVETGDEVEIEESGEYRRYEYDLLNRLVAVYVYDEIADEVSLLVEYGYDVNDLRIYRNGSDGISRYVFDVDGNRIEEQRSAGTDYYVFRNGRYLARRNDGGDIVYYGTDQVGTTVLLTDASGDVVWNGETTPFGDQVAESGPAEGSEALRYQGKEYDPDTGLVYFNARWYDPELGRFITEDPARDGGNWYVFVGNNPLSFVDPSGLEDAPFSESRGDIDFLPTIKEVETGDKWYNNIFDTFAAGTVGIYNWAASAVNMGLNALVSTPGSVNSGIETIDERVSDKWSFTGMGLQEDLFAIGLYFGMDPVGVATALQSLKVGSTFASNFVKGLSQSPVDEVAQSIASIDDVLANPSLLEGKSLTEVQKAVQGTTGWVDDVMRKSSRAEGWVYREMNQAGTDFTGRMIQYHPGTPRHYNGSPYWKVSTGTGGTIRFPAGGN